MSSASDTITPLLQRSRDRLLAMGLYLGDSTVATNVQWVREGRGHVLVYCPKEDTEDSTTARDSTALENVSSNPSTTMAPANSHAPPEGAELTAIVRIEREHFWLTSDAGYLGPTDICKEILDVKPMCAVGDPGVEPVQSDFPTVVDMLRVLTRQCVMPGYSAGPGLFITEKNRPTCVKVRHRLFEPIDCGLDVDEDSEDESTTTDDPYSFEKWPLTRERNRAELVRLKHSHILHPVPAYDLNNDLLHPTTYRRCLRGAIVEIRFTLTHWSIASTKRDVYGAVMKAIRILVPPVVSPTASKKRKLPLHLDIDETPVKKAARE
ncbi:hypothetical protein EDD15DRAFT_2202440 [Pisolithus albus]|nr:hypothetical protein EDD15DRAFT_2202440 [Pisolithus albus]